MHTSYTVHKSQYKYVNVQFDLQKTYVCTSVCVNLVRRQTVNECLGIFNPNVNFLVLMLGLMTIEMFNMRQICSAI